MGLHVDIAATVILTADGGSAVPGPTRKGADVDLSVSSTEQGSVTIVHVAGEIDVYTAPLLREVLDKQVAAGRIALVVDLEKVTFMDSTGLGVLVGRLKLVRGQNGSLRIVSNQDRILKVFKITGLDKVFHIYPTVEEATASSNA
jgi:anti-sigma B factor antagonist